jgi:voltage-dependent calcium channel alpha-2/delta-3
MTDYEWECRERAKQRERFNVYRKTRSYLNLPEDPSNLGYDFIEDDDNDRMKKFNFMTTVSIPVYDKRENAVSRNFFGFVDDTKKCKTEVTRY